jgi:hypothetical protein
MGQKNPKTSFDYFFPLFRNKPCPATLSAKNEELDIFKYKMNN